MLTSLLPELDFNSEDIEKELGSGKLGACMVPRYKDGGADGCRLEDSLAETESH